jgi:uncharacterized protein with ATP-grasp and redox domains
MAPECYQCHLKTVAQLIEKFNPDIEIADSLLKESKQLLTQGQDQSNPLLATQIHRLAKEKINVYSLYRDQKVHANKLLLAQYDYWKAFVNNSDNPLFTATKLAVAGNIIDYGAHTEPADITQKIKELVNHPFVIDETSVLFKHLSKAKSILYLGDNAGEIVFDKLLIETMNHPLVTFVVRGKPVINDVTFEDVGQTALDQCCYVISNGYDAPSTLLAYCSDEFKQAFNQADLIISKGQGNFEGLMNEKEKDIFFLLMAKCRPIADMLGVDVGSLLVKKNNV